MKVCHIWQNFLPLEIGGLERHILTLSDYLHQQNPYMHFLLLTDKSTVPILQLQKIPKRQKFNSLEVYRLGPSLISVLRGVFLHSFHLKFKFLDKLFTIGLYREAASWRETRDVDIFHIHGIWEPQYPIIGSLLSQHFHRPLVVSLHGDVIGPPYGMSIDTAEMINLLNYANIITTFSKDILHILRELGLEHKSYLIPNFIDTKKFTRQVPAIDTHGSRIVMVSRLDAFKDPITPILAFRIVKKEVPEATFKVVGYGPLYGYLTELVRKLNLQDSVILAGKHFNVRKFLWDSDVFVATKSYITVLEAWAAGLAVVAPKFGILKEIISDNDDGILVPPGDVKQLATALIRLLKDENLRKKLVISGRQKVMKYDIRCVAQQIANIYNSL
jgi:glycosyltransferase involved in cell wall biosynthesis